MPFKNNVLIGIAGMLGLLALYFGAVGLISGMPFAVSQFSRFWYYLVPLAVGFGIQVGLFAYLRRAGTALVVSGVTSTGAMLACCAHYVANIAPLLVTAGAVSFIAQYQVQFFWVGLLFNVAGIIYIVWKIQQFKRHLSQMAQN